MSEDSKKNAYCNHAAHAAYGWAACPLCNPLMMKIGEVHNLCTCTNNRRPGQPHMKSCSRRKE